MAAVVAGLLLSLGIENAAKAEGPNLIVNGNFEAGNFGFVSQYAYKDPIAATSSYAMWAEGAYTVYSSANAVHSLWTTVPDHSDGESMLIVNGDETSSFPVVWQQNIAVNKNTNYVFTYYLASVYPLSPARIQTKINGINLGVANAPTSPSSGWIEVSYEWNSGDSELAQISFVDLNAAGGGNDFAIDDISFCSVGPPDRDGDGVPDDDDLFPDDPKRATIVDHINCIIEYVSDDEVIFDSDWKNNRMRVAYINKLEVILELVTAAEAAEDPEAAALIYAEALDKVNNDLIKKTDGLQGVGASEKNDWILVQEAQDILYPDLLFLSDYLWLQVP